jgi:hypothetical protein
MISTFSKPKTPIRVRMRFNASSTEIIVPTFPPILEMTVKNGQPYGRIPVPTFLCLPLLQQLLGHPLYILIGRLQFDPSVVTGIVGIIVEGPMEEDDAVAQKHLPQLPLEGIGGL